MSPNSWYENDTVAIKLTKLLILQGNQNLRHEQKIRWVRQFVHTPYLLPTLFAFRKATKIYSYSTLRSPWLNDHRPPACSPRQEEAPTCCHLGGPVSERHPGLPVGWHQETMSIFTTRENRTETDWGTQHHQRSLVLLCMLLWTTRLHRGPVLDPRGRWRRRSMQLYVWFRTARRITLEGWWMFESGVSPSDELKRTFSAGILDWCFIFTFWKTDAFFKQNPWNLPCL